MAALIERAAGLAAVPAREVLQGAGLDRLADAVRLTAHGLQMTPLRTGTDGFYVAVARRAG